MSFKPKLWLGVGAFALAGAANPAGADPAVSPEPTMSRLPSTANAQTGHASELVILAEARGLGSEGGEAGEGGERGTPRKVRHAREGRARGVHRRKQPSNRVIHRNRGLGGEGGERGSAPRSSLQGGEGGERGAPGIAGP